MYLQQLVFVQSFAQDLPEWQALLLAATQRPLTLAAGNQPSGEPAWRTLPFWYLLGTEDKIITPALQRAMAKRAGSLVEEVHASHLSLISHPRAVVTLIRDAAYAAQ